MLSVSPAGPSAHRFQIHSARPAGNASPGSRFMDTCSSPCSQHDSRSPVGDRFAPCGQAVCLPAPVPLSYSGISAGFRGFPFRCSDSRHLWHSTLNHAHGVRIRSGFFLFSFQGSRGTESLFPAVRFPFRQTQDSAFLRSVHGKKAANSPFRKFTAPCFFSCSI